MPCPPPAPPGPAATCSAAGLQAQPKSSGFRRPRPRGRGCRQSRSGGCPPSGCRWTASHAAWLTSLMPQAQLARLPDVAHAPPPPPRGGVCRRQPMKGRLQELVPPPRLGRPPHSCACASRLRQRTAAVWSAVSESWAG